MMRNSHDHGIVSGRSGGADLLRRFLASFFEITLEIPLS
jgi:hypothetical protein